MRVAQEPAEGFSARVKGCARWLSMRVLGCARPEASSFRQASISGGPDGVLHQLNPSKDSLLSVESQDEELASFELITRSSFAASDISCEGAVRVAVKGVADVPTDAASEADTEVEACLAAVALSVDVPCLDPNSKRLPEGATLLQQSACSSAWVAPLWAPSTDADGNATWQQQPMLVKIHKFYSGKLAAELRASAASARNSAKQKKVYVPTQRDAMNEVRMAVKLACASVRRIRGAASSSAAPPSPIAAVNFSDDDLPRADSHTSGGRAGEPMLPLHVEVRPCMNWRRGKGGPDQEVVAVYPYHLPQAGESDALASAAAD